MFTSRIRIVSSWFLEQVWVGIKESPDHQCGDRGQDDRRVPSHRAVVLKYDLSSGIPSKGGVVKDESGNAYDGHVAAGSCVVGTPLGSKGHNYTLLVRVALSGAPGTLLSGPDDEFGVAVGAGGRLTLAFTSSNITYPLSNFTFPAAPSTTNTTQIVLTASEGGTSAFVDGAHAGDFLVSIDGTSVMEPMAFVAPVHTLGGAGGCIENIVLWDGIQSSIDGLGRREVPMSV